MRKLVIFLLFSLLAPPLLSQERKPVEVPLVAVPDVRKVNLVLFSLSVLEDFDSLVALTERTKVEQALCLYGMIVNDSIIHVSLVAPPAQVEQQDSVSITVRCYGGEYFLGVAHTHAVGGELEYRHVLADFRNLAVSQSLLLGVVIRGSKLLWFTRFTFSSIWDYVEGRRKSERVP